MKISVFETEIIPEEKFQSALEFLQFRERNFVSQVNFLGLDPKADFQHADLTFADFSNCDLRGYNFTGADLRGCVGVNVIWDSSTVLADVDAEGSLFSYFIGQKRFFDNYPEHLDTVRKLTGETWTNAILGVERLLQSDKGKGPSLRIAKAVFDETDSLVVRTNVLAFMRIATDNATDHKSFIYHIFARFSAQPKIIIAGIRTLSAFYQNDLDVFNWLTSFLHCSNEDMRREAFKGLLSSKHFPKAFNSMREYAYKSDDSLTRRAFVGKVAWHAGPYFVRAAMDPELKNFLDFHQPVSQRKPEKAAFNDLLQAKSRKRDELTSNNLRGNDGAVSLKEYEILELAQDYKKCLTTLALQYGVPFVFD